MVQTTVPVTVVIEADDEDGTSRVSKVVVHDDEIAESLAVLDGVVLDENRLEVKPDYTDGAVEDDWPLIQRAYDDSEWPAWEFGW